MFERQNFAERLRDNADIFEIAAALYSDEDVSIDLERLAKDCRQTASAMMRNELRLKRQ